MDKRTQLARSFWNILQAENPSSDLVQLDALCGRLADAAIAALEPQTVREAARVLLEAAKPTRPPLKAGAIIGHSHIGPAGIKSLRALAERGE